MKPLIIGIVVGVVTGLVGFIGTPIWIHWFDLINMYWEFRL